MAWYYSHLLWHFLSSPGVRHIFWRLSPLCGAVCHLYFICHLSCFFSTHLTTFFLFLLLSEYLLFFLDHSVFMSFFFFCLSSFIISLSSFFSALCWNLPHTPIMTFTWFSSSAGMLSSFKCWSLPYYQILTSIVLPSYDLDRIANNSVYVVLITKSYSCCTFFSRTTSLFPTYHRIHSLFSRITSILQQKSVFMPVSGVIPLMSTIIQLYNTLVWTPGEQRNKNIEMFCSLPPRLVARI